MAEMMLSKRESEALRQIKAKVTAAFHVVDFVLDAGAGPRTEALEFKSSLLESLAAKETSLIARNIFLGGMRQIAKEMEQAAGETDS